MCLTFLFFKKFISFNKWAIHDFTLFRSIKGYKYIHIGNSAIIKISDISGCNLQVSHLGPGIMSIRNKDGTIIYLRRVTDFKNLTTEILYNAFKYLGAIILSRNGNIKYLSPSCYMEEKRDKTMRKEYLYCDLFNRL